MANTARKKVETPTAISDAPLTQKDLEIGLLKTENKLIREIHASETMLVKDIRSTETRLIERINGVEIRMDEKINGVEAKLDDKINGLEVRLNDKINSAIFKIVGLLGGLITVMGFVLGFLQYSK